MMYGPYPTVLLSDALTLYSLGSAVPLSRQTGLVRNHISMNHHSPLTIVGLILGS